MAPSASSTAHDSPIECQPAPEARQIRALRGLPGQVAIKSLCFATRGRRRGRNRGIKPGIPRYAGPVAALSEAELAAMADYATVDAYGEDEQAMGFHAVIVDNLKMPFMTSVLGVEVTVPDIDLAGDNSILAICARDGFRQAIRLVDLPLPEPPPAGTEWIEAYRYWLG